MEIEYTIEKSRRRTLSMEVKPDGTVMIKAPKFVSDAEIGRFVSSRSGWIEKTVKKVLVKNAGLSEVERMTDTELKALKRKARAMIMPLVEEYADLMGVTYGTVSIRAQKTRWGSCSSAANISLSTYLMLLPPDLADYVMLHELCHTCEMNHGKKFWALMEKVTDGCSDSYRARLKNYRTSL